jgi:hypothetical protein
MKGSDKWGQGGGAKIRVEVLLAALVVATLVGVYIYVEGNSLNSGARVGVVSTISTTGVQCDGSSMPQSAQAVEQDPMFTDLSNGLCYNYLGGSEATMTFAYYNGTIAYPCGDAPLQPPASEIVVNVTSSQSALSARLLNSSQIGYPHEPCGSIPLDVTSVTDVESTIPAVPQLNVTLSVPTGGRSIASLGAVLTLDGGSQTFRFGSVTSGSPLRSPGSISSTEIILSNLSFNANEVYPMAISGTYVGGQSFSYLVHVEIAQIP